MAPVLIFLDPEVKTMRPRAIIAVLLLVCTPAAFAQGKRKVIIDQDARGPATTDQQSILVFLQSPEVDCLGITVVSGDITKELQRVRGDPGCPSICLEAADHRRRSDRRPS